MKPASLAIELEDLCTEVGYRVRRENGSFSGSDCVLEGEKLILLNRKRPPETHVGTLARVLRNAGVDGVFVKPAVRRELERVWSRMDALASSTPPTDDPADSDTAVEPAGGPS